MKLKSAIALAALILCAGCAKKEAPADTAASANAAVSAAPSAAPAATADTAPAADTTAASTDPNHVPVTTDYEDQAQKDVTAANVSGKLDDLEKEINSK